MIFDRLRKRQAPPILRATFGNSELCRIAKPDVPCEVTPCCEVQAKSPVLVLTDSSAAEHAYDLSSVLSEGARWLHFSIRVGPTYGVQADCLLADSEVLPAEGFARGETKGIRFQPLYLPECESSSQELVGRGLFFRGFHFRGSITPGNVSLLCLCDVCRKSFRLQSFHAGFSSLTYMYCSGCPGVIVASSCLADAPPVLGEADPEAVRRFEGKLPPCERCGGTFAYHNPLRCPHCRAPYIDFAKHPDARETEYYGNHLYGEALQEYRG